MTQITAHSDRDVFYAMGYLHARDRTWELELGRRTAQGRVSEMLGQSALQQDIWIRTLGLYRAAKVSEKYLSGEALASLQAYAEGVNRGFKEAAPFCPELVTFGVRPEPWQVADSLSMLKLVALSMAGSLTAEIERTAALRLLNKAQTLSLFSEGKGAIQAGLSDRYLELAKRLAESQPASLANVQAVGSNAWVIAGSHTRDGKPILANDPHMTLTMPSAWYAVRQAGPLLKVDGMTLVGLPLVIFGKNRNIAWGGTNLMADASDLFVELPVSGSPGAYVDGAGTKPFVTRTEVITIAPKSPSFLNESVPPVHLLVRETERGPVISDALGQPDLSLALRWTGLDANDTSYDAFLRMNRARNWMEFRAAAAVHVAPSLNLLYADDNGNIGYVVAGRIPVRAQGIGDYPRPGWSGAFRWKGYVPADRLPSIFNPPKGYLVSANNQMDEVLYPDFISNDWAEPFRARRIDQMLRADIDARKKVDISETAMMQNDVVSLEAAQMLPVFLGNHPVTFNGKLALSMLRRWDGRMAADSTGAVLFEAWLQRLRERLVSPVVDRVRSPNNGGTTKRLLINKMTTEVLLNEVRSDTPAWCAKKGCAAELSVSLEAALRDLEKLAGSDPNQWRWGELHQVRLAHIPFSKVPLLSPLFDRRYPSAGSRNTVNAANARFDLSNGYEQTFGAAFRQVMQPGLGRHLYVNSTGQIANPLSVHYDDMIEAVQAGSLFELGPVQEVTGVLQP